MKNVGDKLPSRFLTQPSAAEGIDLECVAECNPGLKEVISMSMEGTVTAADRLAGQCSFITNCQELLAHLNECALPERFTNYNQTLLIHMCDWMDNQQLKGWGLDTVPASQNAELSQVIEDEKPEGNDCANKLLFFLNKEFMSESSSHSSKNISDNVNVETRDDINLTESKPTTSRLLCYDLIKLHDTIHYTSDVKLSGGTPTDISTCTTERPAPFMESYV